MQTMAWLTRVFFNRGWLAGLSGGTPLTHTVWIAIGLAGVAFCVFAGWPLYLTYKTRGQGTDVAEGQAYFKARAGAGQAQAGTGPAAPAQPGAHGWGPAR